MVATGRGSSCGTFLLIASMTVASAGEAQTSRCGVDSPIPFARVVMAHLCELAKVPEVAQATGAKDALDLMAAMPPDVLLRVGDAELIAFSSLFSDNLGRLEPQACADFVPRPGAPEWAQQFLQVAMSADSALARRWATFVEAWVWVRVRNTPRQPSATADQAIAYVRGRAALLTRADREAVTAHMQGKAADTRRVCRLARSIFDGIAGEGQREGARILRTMMTGQLDWSRSS